MSDDLVLDGLAAEFADRVRRGDQPTVEEYQERYPDLADKIAELFPTVADLERLGDRRAAPDSTATSIDVGARRFGEYRVVRELGRGGMGIVWLAEQPALRRQVAVKALPSAHADRASRDRFAREARLAARLVHPGIVAIHAVGEDDGTPWIAMQLVDGCSLDDVVQALDAGAPLADDGRGLAGVVQALDDGWGPSGTRVERRRPPWYHRVAVEATLQAADALRYAHEHGVLHRDVKPANLLVDRDGRVLVSDFGLATAGDEQQVTSGSKITGTLQYVAPERFHGVTDARCDVYSLGLVLYELLALKPAFDQPSQAQMLRAVLDVGVPPPRSRIAGLPEPLEQVLTRACARDPKQRYPTMAAFARDLRALSAGHAPLVPTASGARAGPWIGGGIVVAAAIVALALRTQPSGAEHAAAPTAASPAVATLPTSAAAIVAPADEAPDAHRTQDAHEAPAPSTASAAAPDADAHDEAAEPAVQSAPTTPTSPPDAAQRLRDALADAARSAGLQPSPSDRSPPTAPDREATPTETAPQPTAPREQRSAARDLARDGRPLPPANALPRDGRLPPPQGGPPPGGFPPPGAGLPPPGGLPPGGLPPPEGGPFPPPR